MKYFKIVAVLLVMVFLVACGGGGGSHNNKVITPTINIQSEYHEITFNKTGPIQGVIYSKDIYPREVVSVTYQSDRVGWFDASVAIVPFATNIKIIGTANNDIGNWALILNNGDYVWFDITFWHYTGLTTARVGDQIQYGNYIKSIIEFEAPGTVTIYFGCNLLSGFMSPVAPVDVEYFQWNSNKVGWNEGSYATGGQLETDIGGNYYVILEIPPEDIGNFSILLKNGNFVWLSINAGWDYSANATLDHNIGQIQYKTY